MGQDILNMRRRWVSSLPSLMLLSLCLACDIPERPKTTTISNPPAFRPSSPKDVKTPEQALGAIITVCRDALHLPVVNPVHLSVYKNTASYAFYGYGWSTLPFDVRNSTAKQLKRNGALPSEARHVQPLDRCCGWPAWRFDRPHDQTAARFIVQGLLARSS
jgi:hypothetical protein